MRKFLLTASCFVIVISTFAQYCGNSGVSQCLVSGNIITPGLSPMSDSLPPFVNNIPSTTVIQFRNFDVVYFNNLAFTLQSLRIDSIENLPNGLCWSLNNANNTYLNSENGCIKVNGTPCDATGQYKLRIIATATLQGGFSVQVNAADVGLHYYVRVINSGDPVIPVDTLTSIPFVPYGAPCLASPPPVVNLGADQNVCTGSTVSFNPTISGGIPPYTYLWTSIGDAVACDTCANTSATLTQNSTYILEVTDAANNTGIDTVSYTVAGSGGSFQITSSGNPSICKGNSVTLSASENPSFTIQWQRNGVPLNGANDTTLTIADSSGAYSVLFSSGGCDATSNVISVAVNDTPSVTVSPSGNITLCLGENATLQATATAGVSYLWQMNGNDLSAAINPSYSVSLSGTYRVIVKTSADCADTSNAVVVSVNPLPSVSLAPFSPDTVCTTSSAITLTGGTPAGGTYNGIGVTGTTFSPSTSGTGAHTVSYSYTDGNGCTNAATQTIVVTLCTGIEDIELSNFVNVYPNPAKEEITIASDFITETDTKFFIYDVSGKTIAVPHSIEDGKIRVNTTSLPENIYLLKVNINGTEISKRFVKM